MLARRVVQSDYLTLAMCGLLIAVNLPITPGFATVQNAGNVLTVAAPLMLLALGQMLVMLCGGIDLSITAIVAVCSVLGAWLMSADKQLLSGSVWAAPIGLLSMPLLGACLGFGNGLSVTYLKMPPFIVTLTSMMFLYGLATWLTRSDNIAGLPISFVAVGSNLYLAVFLVLSICLGCGWLLSYSKYGLWIYTVGRNCETANVSGVPVLTTILSTYVAAGMLAGLASVIYTAQLETGSPVLAKNQMLDVIGAVVIGGTSLFGGRGKVRWTAGGVLFISLLDNALNLQSLSHFTVMMAKGLLVLVASAIDSLRHRWSELS